MGILSLEVEAWFDRRWVREIRALIASDERLREASDPEATAIYRVPLPASLDIRLTSYGRRAQVRRSLAELIGLGHRLYVVDPAPLAGFRRPLAAYVFTGLSPRPTVVFPFDAHLFLNDEPLPLFDAPTLRAWAVDNRGAIPSALEAFYRPPDGIGRQPPLAPDFPPDDLPTPAANDPLLEPTPPEGPAPVGADGTPCTPTLLFYALCFQNPLVPNNPGAQGDFLWGDAQLLANAFGARGYGGFSYCAGPDHPTFDSMIRALKADLARQRTFCTCPSDQLVIGLLGHGGKPVAAGTGSIAFVPNKDTSEDITVARIFESLAGIPALTGQPRKVYLLVESCYSGQFLKRRGANLGKLAGMNLVTSTMSDQELSYGKKAFFAKALLEGVKSWSGLISKVKQQAKQAGPPIPIPVAETIRGCRLQITLEKVEYTGDDLGEAWGFEVSVVPGTLGDSKGYNAGKTRIPRHTVRPGETTREDILVHDGIEARPCGVDFPIILGGIATRFTATTETDGDEALLTVPLECRDPPRPDTQVTLLTTFTQRRATPAGEVVMTANLELTFKLSVRCV